MERPRRRSAARPAGPPNPQREPEITHPHPGGSPTAEFAEPTAAPAPDVDRPSDPQQHRRRQRAARQGRDAEPGRRTGGPDVPKTNGLPTDEPRTSGYPPVARDDRRREATMERSLRALVSTRTTQLPPTVAMRAREVAAPSAADLALAEQELVIVRRFYVPPAPLVAGKGPEPRGAQAQSSRAEGRRGGRYPQRGGA